MLISQISTLDSAGAAVLSDLIKKSQFIGLADFREDGTDYMIYEMTERSNPAFRAKNGSYTPGNDNPSPELGALKFLGKEAVLDKSYKIDAEKGDLNLERWKMRLLKRHAYSLARGFDIQTFTGDGAGNNIKGFDQILDGVTNVGGFGDTMTISGDDIDLTGTTNYDAFQRLLDEALYEVPGANVLAVNEKLGAIINTIGRKSGNLDRSKDAFGRPYVTYDGIPIVRLNDGAIANNEANSGATLNDSTSLYIMRMEEVDGVTLSSNSGLQFTNFPELEASVTEKARMELYYNITIEAPDAIRRLQHLKVA